VTERLVITRLAHRGDGIAETPAGPLYVPYTLPGETVEVAPVVGHPDRRHLLHVQIPSPERLAPICPHFGTCGGCAIQHWSEANYRAWKRELVIQALSQAAIEAPVEELIDAHGEGRRRATFHARHSARGTVEVGFAALRAHQIVGIDRCPVLAPALEGALRIASAIAEALSPQRKPLDIQFTATEAGLDVDIRGSGALPASRMTALAQLAATHAVGRLTRHGELIAQRTVPTVRMGRARVGLPPGAFLQATHAGEAALAKLVLAHVGKPKNVADLFSGLGPFALRLAEHARVAAFDSDGGGHDERFETGEYAGARPVPPATGAAGAESLRCGGVRSATPGRRGAGARAGQEPSADGGGCLLQPSDVRARRAHPG
jgi:23S rRNA (uracil1939-C5)-methyltransferase